MMVWGGENRNGSSERKKRRESGSESLDTIDIRPAQYTVVLLRINWARKGFSFDKSLQMCKIFLSKKNKLIYSIPERFLQETVFYLLISSFFQPPHPPKPTPPPPLLILVRSIYSLGRCLGRCQEHPPPPESYNISFISQKRKNYV